MVWEIQRAFPPTYAFERNNGDSEGQKMHLNSGLLNPIHKNKAACGHQAPGDRRRVTEYGIKARKIIQDHSKHKGDPEKLIKRLLNEVRRQAHIER
jgi:hypothetical protein